MELLECVISAWRVFRTLRKIGDNSLTYFACERYGVPKTIVLIGRGREAWRVSDFAANYRLGSS